MSTPGSGGPQPPEQHPDPSGQFPGWGQPPAGQPQPGQQPWGAPQQLGGAQAFGQPQKPRRRWLPIIGGLVALVVVLGALSAFLGGGDPEVGDCIHQTGPAEYETVDCDSADADFSIVGEDEEMTGEEFDASDVDELCTDYPDATSVLWYGTDNDEDGRVYCGGDV